VSGQGREHRSEERARSGASRGSDDGAVTAVRVQVPATSANLGPAFDSAGLALTRHDVLEFAETGSGLAVEVSGVGAGELPTDESHLVVRAFRAACAELGWSPAGLRVVAENTIPQGRGMGSSAAAVVAGVVGAWALCPDVGAVDRDAVLRLTTELEGHPDNVAACLRGGFTLAWLSAEGPGLVRLDPHPDLAPIVCVPDLAVSTAKARGLLPHAVPHTDAAANAGRAALLVVALTRSLELLYPATEDRLHQTYRAPAMPESAALVDKLRSAGVPAVISGAGPTVLALTVREDAEAVAGAVGGGWSVRQVPVDRVGAHALEHT
jgi:homoserine kinase